MNLDKLELLEYYIRERKLAKINHDLGKKPFCNDEIINNHLFVNISRRDDFVSQLILKKYLNKCKNIEDYLLNIGIARWFSRATTINTLPIYEYKNFNINSFIKDIEDIRNIYGKISTGRFLICCLDYKIFINSLINYINNFNNIFLESKEIFAKSISKKYRFINVKFFKWQFLSDLVMFNLIPDDNKFIILGPGAKKGLKLLDSSIEELHKILNLSYEDLEHTLCEFYKYNCYLNRSKN